MKKSSDPLRAGRRSCSTGARDPDHSIRAAPASAQLADDQGDGAPSNGGKRKPSGHAGRPAEPVITSERFARFSLRRRMAPESR